MTEAVAEESASSGSAAKERALGPWLFGRMIRVYAASAVVSIAVGGVFFLFGLDLRVDQMKIIFGLVAPLALMCTVVADVLVIRALYRPVGAFFAAPPGAEAAALAPAALVRARNLPLYSAMRVMLVHLPAFGLPTLLLSLLANHVLGLGVEAWQLIVAAVTMLLFAVGHAIHEYFGVGTSVRSVIPAIRRRCPVTMGSQATPNPGPLRGPDSGAATAERIVRVDTKRKLLAISTFLVLVPMAGLGVTVLLKIRRIFGALGAEVAPGLLRGLDLWVLLFVLVASIMGLMIAILMAREISWLAGELRDALRRVESGALDTRVEAVTTDEFADVYEGFNRMTHGLEERERLRDAFGKYVAPEVADEIMRGPMSLRGSTIDATVLFADIRGFTALSERLRPAEVVAFLNRYVAAVEPAIRAERGYINKFGGDSILAVFGAPVAEPEHVRRAVRAALGMHAALARFNEAESASGLEPVRIGIGIHCGEMVAGSVGSPERMEYTVIGDVVNVASRIQSLNKDYGTEILISGRVHDLMGDEAPARALPPATVRGKSAPIVVYTLDPDIEPTGES